MWNKKGFCVIGNEVSYDTKKEPRCRGSKKGEKVYEKVFFVSNNYSITGRYGKSMI